MEKVQRECDTGIEVCGTRWCGGRQKWTGWWNEEVKAAVKNKKITYNRWLQLRMPEAREEYVEAKIEANT